jgi:hypothetical protein
VAVSATASDNVGVVGVQFLLDGVALGAEVTAAPYTVSWNTASATNGAHSLTARARDAAGNQTTSAAVGVTVSNAAPSGLVAGLSLNEGAGTTAADVSGGGHPGAITGATWAAGQYGGGLSYGTASSAMTLANPSTLNFGSGDFTVMMWIKRNALGGSVQRHLWSKCAASAWQTGCKALYFQGNSLRFGSFVTGDSNAGTISDRNWHHIAAVFTRATSRLQIYVDGTLRTSATKDLEPDNAAHVVTIGNMLGSTAFSGLVDEVRIYNHALSAAEVAAAQATPLQP